MTRFFHNDVLDAAADKVATGTHATVCSAAPANYAGIDAVALAAWDIDSGDWTVQDGVIDGRRATLGAQSGAEAEASDAGDTLHLAIDDGDILLAVTEIPSKPITEGNPVNVAAVNFGFRAPTAP